MSAKLILKLEKSARADYYLLERIIPSDGRTEAAWRLTKPSGKSYVVSRDKKHGTACECKDWVYRKRNTADPVCKHVKSLQEVGLL